MLRLFSFSKQALALHVGQLGLEALWRRRRLPGGGGVARGRGGGGGGIGLVQVLDALVQIVLDGGEGGHNGGRAKPMGDHGEVGEVALNAGVQDGLGPGVAERGPVLVQQVHELLADVSEEEILIRTTLKKCSM